MERPLGLSLHLHPGMFLPMLNAVAHATYAEWPGDIGPFRFFLAGFLPILLSYL